MSSIAALARAGATAFRLNASHLDAGELGKALARVRVACPDAPIVVDLQGAKMRIDLPEPRAVAEGETLRLTEGPGGDAQVPHGEFFRQVRPGDTVSLDDGRLRFEVEAVAAGRARVRALGAGRLLHRKGVNVEQHPVRLERLTTRDREACRVAADYGVSAFAYSFMTDGREADWVREQVPGCARRRQGRTPRGDRPLVGDRRARRRRLDLPGRPGRAAGRRRAGPLRRRRRSDTLRGPGADGRPGAGAPDQPPRTHPFGGLPPPRPHRPRVRRASSCRTRRRSGATPFTPPASRPTSWRRSWPDGASTA